MGEERLNALGLAVGEQPGTGVKHPAGLEQRIASTATVSVQFLLPTPPAWSSPWKWCSSGSFELLRSA